MAFPKDFLWGVATSSYQIEGAVHEGGRSESIWDRFCDTPGKVKGGATGAVACDHYHLFPQDVALMKKLGVQSYRFSIAWPRIQSAGTGAANTVGLDFYSRLTDELLKYNIMPVVTMYHWDLPQSLQDKGGWTNPDMPLWFADYARIITTHLGDRVKFWITLNEPWCTSMLGYLYGIHAPGIQDAKMAYQAAHQTHLSHAAAVRVVREIVPDGKVGITLNLTPQLPATDHPEDVRLARLADGRANRWFLDPVFKGTYPADVVEVLNKDGVLDGINLDEVQAAAVTTDFLGMNYYMRWVIAHDPANPGQTVHKFPADAQYTDMGWEIHPGAFHDMIMRVHQEYNPPAMYITESGAAFAEPDHVDAEVLEDPPRVDYLKGYLGACERAIQEGAPLKGYYAWSFMDNFEWAEGYAKRFGIVHVDYETLERTPKRSAWTYSDIIKSGVLA